MRPRTILTALGAVSLVGTALSASPASAAPLDLIVQSVTFGRTKVAVAGLNTVAVPVTVKATYKLGKPGQPLYAEFDNYDGDLPSRRVISEPLKLVEGTGKDGTWQGTVNVPSTADGNLTPTGVVAGIYTPTVGPNPNDSAPVSQMAPLVVTGLHTPKITRKLSANPVPFGKPYQITWQVLDSATGKPYGSRLKVVANRKADACLTAKGTTGAVQTNAAGVIVASYEAKDADRLNCLLIPGTQAPIASHAALVPRPGIVAATPDRTSAKVGTTVPVKGNVAGITYDCPVNLQKLSGATQWRTLRSTRMSTTSRYTLGAPITAKGKGTYRVQFPACQNTLAGVSRTFSITGV